MAKIINSGQANIFPKWLWRTAAIFLAVLIVFSGAAYLYDINYQGKIYAGVKAGNLRLAGKTPLQAKVLLQSKIDRLADQGLDFSYQEQLQNIEPIVAVAQGGRAYELWSYDIDAIVNSLYRLGRQGNWWEGLGTRTKLLLVGTSGQVEFQLNAIGLAAQLKEKFSRFETPGNDAALIWRADKAVLAEEQSGLVFDYDAALEAVKERLAKIDNTPLKMQLTLDEPAVKKSEAEFLAAVAEDLLARAPLRLKFSYPDYYNGRRDIQETVRQISSEDLKSWLKIKKKGELGILKKIFKNEVEPYLGLDDTVVGEYLRVWSQSLDVPAKDAKFVIEDGRVTEWQSSLDGFKLEVESTIQVIESKFIREGEANISLVLSVDKSKITNENVNSLGIEKLIGRGESNFSGSPPNRRHNIAVGAAAINGLLIKPGEEFSLNEALGEIDAAAGYKPEFVIKGDRTIPEYGGGLCQIGTTLFRAAINTGLPITERRNHSYRVGYYEPAGTDATIYGPWPDLKFVNDSGHYALLQTRIEGDNAIFEIWGTSDGRAVKTTDPIIYNIVPPGEPKLIKTAELPPGEKKRIDRAHSGADAYFKRTIVWPKDLGREPVEETFSSHYIPWKEVWLVGEEIATSTAEILN